MPLTLSVQMDTAMRTEKIKVYTINVKQLVRGKNLEAFLDLLQVGKQFAKCILFYCALENCPRFAIFIRGPNFLVVRKVSMFKLKIIPAAAIINIPGESVH